MRSSQKALRSTEQVAGRFGLGARPLSTVDLGFLAVRIARAMIELTQEFGFDAAHYLGQGAPENARLHGHSFYAEVTLRGNADPKTGWLRDLGEVKAVLEKIRASLDHRLLNEVEGLSNPTLENLARHIYVKAKAGLPEVARVRLRRPSYGQACVYEE